MGRENEFSPQKKNDFDIIKQKYHNIIDILTYDELIKRLETIISAYG